MKEQEKTDLFVKWAYLKSKKTSPKYQQMSEEQWVSEISLDKDTSSKLAEEAKDMNEDDFKREISQLTPLQFASNGAKLDNLKVLNSLKKGGKMTKKCSCGCEIVQAKESGGKLISKCACGCKPKKEKGGSLDLFDNDYFAMPKQKMNSHKIKKFKE